MGFAPSLDQVAVESKNVEGHDVALAITRNGGWYADAKEALVGAGRDNSRQFRLVKTGKANVYKLYSVKKQKFVAYTDANQGDRKTKFVDNATDANTDWLIVPNIGANGTTNNFDIFPGSVSSPKANTPAWNAFGGANEGARIGLYAANDGGSCWSIEVAAQELKFFSSYSATNESYFMTIRDIMCTKTEKTSRLTKTCSSVMITTVSSWWVRLTISVSTMRQPVSPLVQKLEQV